VHGGIGLLVARHTQGLNGDALGRLQRRHRSFADGSQHAAALDGQGRGLSHID